MKTKIDKYNIDTRMTVTQRIANFLDWAIKNGGAREVIAYNDLFRAVIGGKRPRMTSPEIKTLRHKMGRVRQILREDYERDLISVPGVGVRASVDSEDLVRNALPPRARAARSANSSLTRTVGLVDQKTLPHTAEFAPYRKWLGEITTAARVITSGGLDRLRPNALAATNPIATAEKKAS